MPKRSWVHLCWGRGASNFYGYVGNNPINDTDPTGLAVAGCTPKKHGKPGVPWKVVQDPDVPTRSFPLDPRSTMTIYCFIIVDESCNPYKNSQAIIDELVVDAKEGNLNPRQPWAPVLKCDSQGSLKDMPRATPPKFCDPMPSINDPRDPHGNPETTQDRHQCYSLQVPDPKHPDKMKRIILKPCPFLIRFGPTGTSRIGPGEPGFY